MGIRDHLSSKCEVLIRKDFRVLTAEYPSIYGFTP